MSTVRQPLWIYENEIPQLPEDWQVLRTEDACIQLKPGKLFETKTVSDAGAVPVLNQSGEGYLGYHDEVPGVEASAERPVVTFANHTCALRLMKTPFSSIQNVFPKVGVPGLTDTTFFYYAVLGRVGFTDYKGHHPLFRQMFIPVPPLPTQRRIAGILSAYDELIANNQRRIAILEEMARALYREWFVRYNAPGVVMGEEGVPEGWEVKPVGALVSRMQAPRVYREADVAVQGVVPVLDQSTNEVLGFHDSDADLQASAERPLILFGDHTCKQQLIIEPFSIGPNTIVFEASRPQCTTWLHHALLGMLHTQEYKRHWSQLTSKEIVTPPSDVAHQFAALLKPWTEQTLVHARTNQNLRRTRDLLLPRLMSGRVELELSEQ